MWIKFEMNLIQFNLNKVEALSYFNSFNHNVSNCRREKVETDAAHMEYYSLNVCHKTLYWFTFCRVLGLQSGCGSSISLSIQMKNDTFIDKGHRLKNTNPHDTSPTDGPRNFKNHGRW